MNSPARFKMLNRKQKTVVCTARQARPEEDIHAPGFMLPNQDRRSLPCAKGHLGHEQLSHLGMVVSRSWVVFKIPPLFFCLRWQHKTLAVNATDDHVCSSANGNTRGPRVLCAEPSPSGSLMGLPQQPSKTNYY